MLDTLCRFFLFFSQHIFIIPILIIGLLFINRQLFFQITSLFLASIVMNVALKVGFHIPLPETVAKNWFAFPSGHMQASTVLYGCFATHLKQRPVQILLVSLLLGIGLSLVHFGYHTFEDVLGGLFFGALILCAYFYLQKHLKQSNVFLLMLTALLLGYIHLAHLHIPEHAWQASGGLASLILGQNSFNKKHFLSAKKMLAFLSVISLFAFFLFQLHFSSSFLINCLFLLLIFMSSAFHGSKKSIGELNFLHAFSS